MRRGNAIAKLIQYLFFTRLVKETNPWAKCIGKQGRKALCYVRNDPAGIITYCGCFSPSE